MKKYAHKAAQALPPTVVDVQDRLDRAAGLALAMFSELGNLPSRAEADEFFATLPVAYAELMELYFFGAAVCAPSPTQSERERAAGC
jgi:hypothetical protein